MSLLERINARPLPFAELIGVEFVSAEPDAVEARMVVRPYLCRLGGFAHGGAIMSFADTLGGGGADIADCRLYRSRPTTMVAGASGPPPTSPIASLVGEWRLPDNRRGRGGLASVRTVKLAVEVFPRSSCARARRPA